MASYQLLSILLINSFIQAFSLAPLQVHYYSKALQTQHGYYVSEFHAEAPQATVSEGLAKGPYVAARVGFEPTTIRMKGVESNNETLYAPHLLFIYFLFINLLFVCQDVKRTTRFIDERNASGLITEGNLVVAVVAV